MPSPSRCWSAPSPCSNRASPDRSCTPSSPGSRTRPRSPEARARRCRSPSSTHRTGDTARYRRCCTLASPRSRWPHLVATTTSRRRRRARRGCRIDEGEAVSSCDDAQQPRCRAPARRFSLDGRADRGAPSRSEVHATGEIMATVGTGPCTRTPPRPRRTRPGCARRTSGPRGARTPCAPSRAARRPGSSADARTARTSCARAPP